MFTNESNMNDPDKRQSPFSDIPDHKISTTSVEKQLLSLNAS